MLYAVDLGRSQTAEAPETARAEEAFEQAAAHFELPEGAKLGKTEVRLMGNPVTARA